MLSAKQASRPLVGLIASWSLALPAESSAQAAARAAVLARRVPSARSSHSATAILDDRELAHHFEDAEPAWRVRAKLRELERDAAIRAEAEAEALEAAKALAVRPDLKARSKIKARNDWAPREMHPEPALGKFRRLAGNDPFGALAVIPHMSPRQLQSLSLVEIDSFIASTTVHLGQSTVPAYLDGEVIRTALVQLRYAIHEGPRRRNGPQMRGQRLYRYLRLCLLLGDKALVRSVWKERVQEQLVSGEKIIPAGGVADALAEATQDWRLLLWMFSPSVFPVKFWTAATMERYLQAHLATGRNVEVAKLFAMHAELELKPGRGSWCHLIQSLLAVGNVTQARQVSAQAEEEAGLDMEKQQMALLRGHRTLGAGASKQLEERVLRDIESLGMTPNPVILNALIRLRLDNGDMAGAGHLLGYFNLSKRLEKAHKHLAEPSADSIHLAMKLAVHQKDFATVDTLWRLLLAQPSTILDVHISHVVASLVYAGRRQEALDLIAPSADRPPSAWPLPPGIKPGARTLNRLLSLSDLSTGTEDVVQIIKLFPQLGIQPDEYTPRVLLSVLTRAATPPVRMTAFLTSFLAQHPHLKVSMADLDPVMASAIAHSAPASDSGTTAPSPAFAADQAAPDVGISTRNPFKRAVRRIIQSLKARGQRSTATTLANRLRFDAYTAATTGGGMQSAEAVWNSLIERGYRPDGRHIWALVAGFAEAGAMEEAQSAVHLAEQGGIAIPVPLWTILLTGWGRRGSVRLAESTYAQIKTTATGADLGATSAMVQAYHRNGRFSQAASLAQAELVVQSPVLDDKAIWVAMQALRLNNQELDALRLVQSVRGRPMTYGIRRTVRQMRNWLRKAVRASQPEADGADGMDGVNGNRVAALALCDELLADPKRRCVRRADAYPRVRMRRMMRAFYPAGARRGKRGGQGYRSAKQTRWLREQRAEGAAMAMATEQGGPETRVSAARATA